MTVEDFLTRAFRLAGIVDAIGTPTADMAEDGFNTLNDMIGVFNNDELMLFNTSDAYYTVTAQTPTNPRPPAITIGPTGATITATRPQRIVNASFTVVSTSPNVEIQLTLLNDQQYARIPTKNVGASVDSYLYYSPTWPNGSIYIWPYPTATFKLHLFVWELLTGFTALTDSVDFPPGYNEMMRFNLALRLSAEYGSQISDDVRRIAIESKAAVMAFNFKTEIQAVDPALLGKTTNGDNSTWSYLIGDYMPR